MSNRSRPEGQLPAFQLRACVLLGLTPTKHAIGVLCFELVLCATQGCARQARQTLKPATFRAALEGVEVLVDPWDEVGF